MSTVYGIVRQSGGGIWVHSELGKGTTCRIYLPRVDEVAPALWLVPPVGAAKGTETILVVEDEGRVRQLAQRILQLAGYTVLTAGNGGEALRLLGRYDGPVHLILTDMVMPGMTGKDLVARIGDIAPRMKILFTSGYTGDAVRHDGLLDQGAPFIGKPYTAAELTRKVREVLDS
jgi:CheY-like chemotaxis protein